MLKQIGLIITAMGVWLTLPAVVGAQAQSRPTIDIKINVFRDRNFDNVLNPSREPILHNWNLETYNASFKRLSSSAQHSTQFLNHSYTVDADSAYLCVEPVFNWVQTFPFLTSFAHPSNDSWFCHTLSNDTEVYNFAVFENGQPADDGRNLNNGLPTQLPPIITPGPNEPANPPQDPQTPGQPTNPQPPTGPGQNNPDDSQPVDAPNDPVDTSDDQSPVSNLDDDTVGGQVLGTTDDNTDDEGEVLAAGDVLAETGMAILAVVVIGIVITAAALTSRKFGFVHLLYRR